MKLVKRSLFLWIPLATIGCLASTSTAKAQISPDGTLSTTVNSDGVNFTINNGDRAGGNLFHSFREFSVLTGGSAFFNNALDVQNIISRVTGGSVSNIDGLIRANGSANLFLLNPAGILFGQNARLNVGGSFLATTASSFVFPDGREFSATNPEAPPLLTVSIPNGLRFRENSGEIRVQGLGQDVRGESFVNPTLDALSARYNPTLEVPVVGQTLALVGGNVSLDGGVLQARGGQVEVGGLAAEGTVGLNFTDSNLRSLSFPNNIARADVSLMNGAGINAITSGTNGGSITINARNIGIINGSLNTTTSNFGEGTAGSITLNAADSISLVNESIIQGFAFLEGGNGGNINITSRTLSLKDGSQIATTTFGKGRAGSITVNATDSVVLSGVTPSGGGFSGGFFSTTEEGANGSGGQITVITSKLQISDGAVLSARSRSNFRGGDIMVTANTLEITGGGQILATAFSQGNAGDIDISSNRIHISGSDPTFSDRRNQVAQRFGQDLADIFIAPVNEKSGIFANVDDSTATGGDLTINTTELSVENGGTITVSSPQGQAGNLDITARNIRLNNGSLTAQTGRPGTQEGANINLQGLELLELRNNSLISAQANLETNANGGNINIDAGRGLVVAIPGQNNDIVANASRGRGGNIQIAARGIFGLAVGRSRTANRTNDIDASSDFNNAGSVEFNTPDVDPSEGLVDLPENVIDPSQQIAQTPCQQGASSEFVITGRGGLPTSPNQTLSGDSVRVDLLSPVASTTNAANTTLKTTQLNNSGVKRIVPAQGWIFNEKGQVVLTAYKPNQDSSQRSWKTPTSCAAR